MHISTTRTISFTFLYLVHMEISLCFFLSYLFHLLDLVIIVIIQIKNLEIRAALIAISRISLNSSASELYSAKLFWVRISYHFLGCQEPCDLHEDLEPHCEDDYPNDPREVVVVMEVDGREPVGHLEMSEILTPKFQRKKTKQLADTSDLNRCFFSSSGFFFRRSLPRKLPIVCLILPPKPVPRKFVFFFFFDLVVSLLDERLLSTICSLASCFQVLAGTATT